MNSSIPDENVVRIAVDLACRAPSVHNSQPWRWRYADGQLDLYVDGSRVLTSADPTGRQLVISCGAALNHLQTALTALRWSTDIQRVPEGPRSGHLASIRFRHDARPQSHDFDLLAAIRHRHSDRRPFGPVSPKTPLPASLTDVVHHWQVHLTVLGQDTRPTLAQATEMTANVRKYDSAYQAEIHWWTGHSVSQIGVPPDALAAAESRAGVDIGRRFPGGRDGGTGTKFDHSTVLVLSTDTDGRHEWLRAGEALSVVLLESTLAGLATCPLTHVTELGPAREMIRDLLPDRGLPQVLIRVGVAEAASPPGHTPRRPVESVFSVDRRRSGR
ncbi:Acg family FMN-binding oxidoreductase [Rhodococcus sp. WMMA185]|uniref:Acg family FMN-binding oxidoreductase n=1 Tax=Rhodococcus sp. WMMA185 TaxID=679318 RepID=UPI000B1AE60E|nr:hypothetical protein [Rhodococcus sp. WMMA185]